MPQWQEHSVHVEGEGFLYTLPSGGCCAPIRGSADVSRQAVDDLVMGYLHGAKPYSKRSKVLVIVTPKVVSQALLLLVAFAKIVPDPVNKAAGPATTWRVEHPGLHADDTGVMLDGLGRLVGKFMGPYSERQSRGLPGAAMASRWDMYWDDC